MRTVNGDSLVMHYTGSLLNKEVFDSSVERNKPFEFVLGKGMVIKGYQKSFITLLDGTRGCSTCALARSVS